MNRYSIGFTSGSYQFLDSLRMILQNNIEEIKGNIIKYKPRKFTIRGVNYEGKHNYYVLLFGFHDTILLGNYIYKDSETIRMKRKYYKFLNAKELREKYVEEKRVRE